MLAQNASLLEYSQPTMPAATAQPHPTPTVTTVPAPSMDLPIRMFIRLSPAAEGSVPAFGR